MLQNARLILVLLALNFVGYALSLLSGGRGLINIDYLFSLFVLNSGLSAAYLALVFLVDFFITYASIFHFTPISFIENYELAMGADYKYNSIVIIFFFFIFYAILFCCKKIANIVTIGSKWKRLAGSISIAILLIFDIALGAFNSNGLRYESLLPNPLNINVSTSGFGYLVSEFRTRYSHGEDRDVKKPVASAVNIALDEVYFDGYPDNIILIIIESYGLFKNRAIQNSLLNEFSESIKVEKFIQSGEIPFAGATTSGEVRELCGVQGDYKLALRNFDYSQCLPNRLKSLGYNTSGFHYYYRSGFNRAIWWPNVGLNNLHFLDAYLKKPGVELCGGFLNGGCDKDLIDDLFISVDNADRKSFAYGLTLNSHLPVYSNDHISNVGISNSAHINRMTGSVNELVGSWRVVMKAISDNINTRPNSDMIVVIVGDHSPPFLTPEHRGLFDGAHVPYIIVKTNKIKNH